MTISNKRNQQFISRKKCNIERVNVFFKNNTIEENLPSVPLTTDCMLLVLCPARLHIGFSCDGYLD